MIHNATIKELVCLNIPGGTKDCPFEGFQVPADDEQVVVADPGPSAGPPKDFFPLQVYFSIILSVQVQYITYENMH